MRKVIIVLLAWPAVFAFADLVQTRVRNRNNGTLVSGGERREYLLYVPRSYDAKKPVPLVISMHGAGGWPAQQRNASGWSRLADREGFIVVYPSGGRKHLPRIWTVDDASFIADLIDKLETDYNIDRERIYANGLSNGGGMSFVVSCTLADRIAAVGLVAAAHTMPFSSCRDARPVPVIAFHGTDDRMVPYNGGVSWVSASRSFPSIPLLMEKWARRNRCASVTNRGMRREYANCAEGATVVLYTLPGGGHVWPGGEPFPEWFTGPNVENVDATRMMWSFFRDHPLRAVRSASTRPR